MGSKKARYRELQNILKERIQQGVYETGDFLPSENELCQLYSITRTTVRKALDELLKEGFVEKLHGRGTRVRERRHSLGLLNVKGFSEAVGQNVKTVFLQKPKVRYWGKEIRQEVSEEELNSDCLHFERLRFVGDEAVMLENNWFSNADLPDFESALFIEGSFFKTLSKRYLVEVIGSEQELRSEHANAKVATLLDIKPGDPVLHISMKFVTSKEGLNIYSELYCNTMKYPIGNSYGL
jgi:DNA-binding GntR family transcriptional regulator